jgi:Tfp pilus assembly protein PilN
MRALGINFVRRRRFASPLGFVLLSAGIIAFGVTTMDYLDAQADLERVEARQARLIQSGTKTRKVESPTTAATDEARAVVGLVSQLRQPWDIVLHNLEILADPTVAFLSVEAQGQARKLRINAETKSMDDAIAYVGRLRRSPLVESAVLSGHEVKQSGPVSVIRFTTDATWSQPP